MTFEPGILIFWAIAALAAWVQTLTGFALGLILMGATGALGLMPVPQAAAITSLLVLVNAMLVLSRGWRDVDRPALRLILLGAFPALIAGFFLLNWLAGTALGLLQLLQIRRCCLVGAGEQGFQPRIAHAFALVVQPAEFAQERRRNLGQTARHSPLQRFALGHQRLQVRRQQADQFLGIDIRYQMGQPGRFEVRDLLRMGLQCGAHQRADTLRQLLLPGARGSRVFVQISRTVIFVVKIAVGGIGI